jgi:hypothetical protein
MSWNAALDWWWRMLLVEHCAMRRLRTPNATSSLAPRGRPFANGNPGRKLGSKNHTTVVAAALLDGEAEELVRMAVELAKDGDVPMLKFLLGRILPHERLVKLGLPPMNFADDAVAGVGSIVQAVIAGSARAREQRWGS